MNPPELSPEIKERIARLDKIAPPPRDVLTIEETAKVLDVDDGTLRNMRSQKRLPFQVLKIGGRVKVDKIVLARYMAGLKDEGEKPKRGPGRPKNSDGLQRHATNLFLAAWERLQQQHREDVGSVLTGQTFPNIIQRRLGK